MAPTTKKQAEALVSGFMKACNSLLNLNMLDPKVKTGQAKSALIHAMAKSVSTLDVSAEIERIVFAAAGVTFHTRQLYLEPLRESTHLWVSAKGFDVAKVDRKASKFADKVEANREWVLKQLDEDQQFALKKAETVKEKLQAMNDALDSQNLQAAKDAVRAFVQSPGTTWGIEVNVGQVMDAMKELGKLAKRIMDMGFLDAQRILDIVKDTKANGPGWGNTTVRADRGVYMGELNTDMVATDLWRMHQPPAKDEAASNE